MKVRRKTVLLGWAEYLLWDDRQKQQAVYFNGQECALCCNGAGTEIYLLPAKKMDPTEPRKGKETRLFKRWSGFEAQEAFEIDIPTDRLFRVGIAIQIDYASDKWTGRKAHYRHDFDKKTHVYIDKERKPKVWGLKSSGRRIVTARGIV